MCGVCPLLSGPLQARAQNWFRFHERLPQVKDDSCNRALQCKSDRRPGTGRVSLDMTA